MEAVKKFLKKLNKISKTKNKIMISEVKNSIEWFSDKLGASGERIVSWRQGNRNNSNRSKAQEKERPGKTSRALAEQAQVT